MCGTYFGYPGEKMRVRIEDFFRKICVFRIKCVPLHSLFGRAAVKAPAQPLSAAGAAPGFPRKALKDL